jgi:hypothetical protein
MGIEEGEEVLYKIITENVPNLRKLRPFRYRKLPGH